MLPKTDGITVLKTLRKEVVETPDVCFKLRGIKYFKKNCKNTSKNTL